MWYDFELCARQYRQQREEEARQYRLAREYGAMTAWHRAIHWALAWLGRRMAHWGVRLWVRYGDAAPYRRPAPPARLPHSATSAR